MLAGAQRRDLSYNYLRNIWFEAVFEGGRDCLGRKYKMKIVEGIKMSCEKYEHCMVIKRTVCPEGG